MIYQILQIARDLSRQMLFLDPYYQSLEKQKEYYHANKNVDPASRATSKLLDLMLLPLSWNIYNMYMKCFT